MGLLADVVVMIILWLRERICSEKELGGGIKFSSGVSFDRRRGRRSASCEEIESSTRPWRTWMMMTAFTNSGRSRFSPALTKSYTSRDALSFARHL